MNAVRGRRRTMRVATGRRRCCCPWMASRRRREAGRRAGNRGGSGSESTVKEGREGGCGRRAVDSGEAYLLCISAVLIVAT